MEIIGAKPEETPSKLKPLMAAFQSSPFRVAPERESDMVGLRDKYDIRVHLKANANDWLFEGFRIFELNRIFIGLRSIERLWAYCYAYTTITLELKKAHGDFKAIDNRPEFELAFKLLDWAGQRTLEDVEGGWPDALPDPSEGGSMEYVEPANHFFLMTSGRLLLHEIAHTVLGHHTEQDASSEILMREEFEADAWADDWMLGKWSSYDSDERIFIGRCMGIAFAHAPCLLFGIKRKESSASHPNPVHRIQAFIERYLPNGVPSDKRSIDQPCAFLLVIFGHLLHTHNKPFQCDPLPSSYNELFERFRPYFP
jgi:hypothetical protein